MKKSLIFIAMLAIATALFAENETVSCESDLGKCTYELSSDSLSKECTCRDGNGIGEAEMFENGAASSALPTGEECQAELLIICQDAGINCENEAGECEMKPNGDYTCWCFGIEGYSDGNGVFGEEGCNAAVVEHCGTEPATARTICTDSAIFNVCLSYAQTFANTCYEPLTDEDIETVLDLPAVTNDTTAALAVCCQDEEIREGWFKDSFECLEATESCENKECCETCNVFVLEESNEKDGDDEVISPAPEDNNTDEGETNVPTDGADNGDDSAAPTDGAVDSSDSEEAPADGTATPTEKEESKSDGCSMLFI
ncbi:hypothetical protein J6Z19_05905 [bacterium]|nr:hypothetical protein [bacterium]